MGGVFVQQQKTAPSILRTAAASLGLRAEFTSAFAKAP
jgi:hypothetical protein